jgi:hypothetical protein
MTQPPPLQQQQAQIIDPRFQPQTRMPGPPPQQQQVQVITSQFYLNDLIIN